MDSIVCLVNHIAYIHTYLTYCIAYIHIRLHTYFVDCIAFGYAELEDKEWLVNVSHRHTAHLNELDLCSQVSEQTEQNYKTWKAF